MDVYWSHLWSNIYSKEWCVSEYYTWLTWTKTCIRFKQKLNQIKFDEYEVSTSTPRMSFFSKYAFSFFVTLVFMAITKTLAYSKTLRKNSKSRFLNKCSTSVKRNVTVSTQVQFYVLSRSRIFLSQQRLIKKGWTSLSRYLLCFTDGPLELWFGKHSHLVRTSVYAIDYSINKYV